MKFKDVKHPYVNKVTTLRPYVVGYGCDGSTDANIHYVAQTMVKLLGWDYKEIYEKAYAWQQKVNCGDWITDDLGELTDEALKKMKVKDTTLIPHQTTIKQVLDDLYDINNRSLVEELENRFEQAGIPLETTVKDLAERRRSV